MTAELEAVELDYEFTLKDVKTYYEDYTKDYNASSRSRRYRRWTFYTYYAALIAVPGLCTVAVGTWLHNDFFAFVGLVVSAALWPPTLTNLWRDRVLRHLNKHPGLVGKHQMRISSEGVTDRSAVMAWTIFWSQITDIKVGKRHILFFVRWREQPTVIPIPRHAFANGQEVRAFIEQVSGFWKASAAAESLSE